MSQMTKKPLSGPLIKGLTENKLFAKTSAYLAASGITMIRVGSSCIEGCVPQDIDFLLEGDKNLVEWLIKEGWNDLGSSVPESSFTSLRCPLSGANLIVSHTREEYENFYAAQELVEKHNVIEKYSRIKVFEFLRGDKDCVSPEEFTDILNGKTLVESWPATVSGAGAVPW